MSLLLAVHSYPAASSAHERHLPFWKNAGADSMFIGIGTDDGKCKWPVEMQSVNIGRNSYIDGPVLPKRLIDTMEFMLLLPYKRYAIIEWDCIFFKPLPEFTGMAAFHAGNQLPGMRAQRFHHCPWAFDYEAGAKFVKAAKELLPQVSGHEASPDVFFGWVCEQSGIEVHQPWEQFSRNSLDCAGDLELARQARINGATAIHGVKRKAELDYILS